MNPFVSTPVRRSEPKLAGIPAALFGFASLILLACVLLLGSAISQAGSDERLRRNLLMVLMALLGCGVSFLRTFGASPTLSDRVVAICALLLPCYALLQTVPLPLWLVSFLSPARGELVRALAPITGFSQTFASLSIVPGITFSHFVLICGYAVMFFSVRNLVRTAPDSGWLFTAPILTVAALEAISGFFQLTAGASVRGSYDIKNHFAGLLIMALPFAVAFLLSVANGVTQGDALDIPVGVRFTAALILVALLLLGISFALSRGGFVAALVSAAVLFTLAFPRGMSVRKWFAASSAAGLAFLVGLFFLTPMVVVQRLGEHSSSGRIAIWENTLDLIAAYPLVGCGLGGYESAILRFKTTVLFNDLDYAHNDYLQFFGELGIVGFVIAAAFFATLLVRSVRAAASRKSSRWVAVGCAGALSAILAHSFFDFNLYVPANALVLAWIGGLTAGLPVSRGPQNEALPIEVWSAAPNRSMRFP